jgi:hypothetical protein
MAVENEAGGVGRGVNMPRSELTTIKTVLIINKTLFMQILDLSPLGNILVPRQLEYSTSRMAQCNVLYLRTGGGESVRMSA